MTSPRIQGSPTDSSSRYRAYVTWCRSLGVQPATFFKWQFINGGISPNRYASMPAMKGRQ